VVGASYKPNYPDARGSAALAFARGLSAHHSVVVYDPIVETTNFPQEITLVREVPGARFDAVVIALKHKNTDLDALRKLSPILIDLVRGYVEVTESLSTRK
jgi:UDP-N-acetyl-D-mannosaminuronate dehydrogenase